MARHAHRARVFSCNDVELRSIGNSQAWQLIDSGDAIRVSSRKSDQLAIQLVTARAEEAARSFAAITAREMVRIADGLIHPFLRRRHRVKDESERGYHWERDIRVDQDCRKFEMYRKVGSVLAAPVLQIQIHATA